MDYTDSQINLETSSRLTLFQLQFELEIAPRAVLGNRTLKTTHFGCQERVKIRTI